MGCRACAALRHNTTPFIGIAHQLPQPAPVELGVQDVRTSAHPQQGGGHLPPGALRPLPGCPGTAATGRQSNYPVAGEVGTINRAASGTALSIHREQTDGGQSRPPVGCNTSVPRLADCH
jgi:hypothetical protein